MRLKKLKRLLSLTLSAAMVASTLSVPVRAEGITDQPVPVLEDTADELEDMSADEVTDETEDSEVPDVEEAEETEDEEEVADDEEVAGEDEAEAPVVNAPAVESGDVDPVAEGTETPGTPETPAAEAIVVGGEDAKTLAEAIAEAKAGTVKNIELAGDVTLGAGTYDLEELTIDTKGFMITIAEATEVILNGGTIKNEVLATEDWAQNYTSANVRLMFNVAGTLNINGGTYTTKGTTILSISGNAVIDGAAEFTVNATAEEVAARGDYDGTSPINVTEAGSKLVMKSGTVNSNVGNGTDCGMYGIYVSKGGEVELGVDAQNGPTINSMFSAVAMNGIASPGRITIRGGNYTSSVNCPDKVNHEKFNSVLYLPASANVTINGGTFTATGTGDCHVISAPYAEVNGNKVRMNVNINGGTFKAATGKDVFFGAGFDTTDTTKKVNVKVTGGWFSSDPSAYVAEGYGAYYRESEKLYEISNASVAMIGNKGYESLEDALDAAQEGDTVTLNGNASLTESYTGKTIQTKGYMIDVPAGANVTLTNVTIDNEVPADLGGAANWGAVGLSGRKQMIQVSEKGTLVIEGGEYTSKGNQAIGVYGKLTMKGANVECTATSNEIQSAGWYDGVSLVAVVGTKAEFVMESGSLNANIGDGGENGMYGIAVAKGAKIVLGTENGTEQPTVDSMFAPIAMNGTLSPGTIIVNNGTFNSHVAANGDSNWNAVLYLSAKANVTIKGGTFTANHGTNGGDTQHVISVPYANAGLNLAIEGGTFKVANATAGDALFYDPQKDDTNNKNKIVIRGGSFGFDPSNYLAGCCSALQDSTSGLWNVSQGGGDAAHELTWVARKDSTCWDEGVIGHYECLACGRMYTTKTDSKVELTPEETVIPRKDHAGNGELVPAVAATCTEKGLDKHYKCKNCGMRYDTIDALDADTNGSAGKTESAYETQATGHSFEKEDGTMNVTFDWTKFDWTKFVTGEANNVTAKRTCVNPACSRAENAPKFEEEGTVTVALKDGSSTQITNCTVKQDIVFVATAVFASGEATSAVAEGEGTDPGTGEGGDSQEPVVPNPNTATEENTIEVNAKAHDYSAADFNWGAFDATAFKRDQANGVTASNTCPVCGVQENGTVTVACEDYPTDHALVCRDGKKLFTATAAFGTGDYTGNPEDEQTFTAPHNLNTYEPYVAPTCTSTGQWGYYTCEDCGNSYLGEDSAVKGDAIDITPGSKDITIAKRPHSFVVKELAWTDKSKTNAKVTFHCTNCKEVSFDIPCESVARKDGDDTGVRQCGKEVTWTYTATYKFAREGIVEGADGKFSYSSDAVTAAGKEEQTRTGELTKKVTEPHELGIANVGWVSTGQTTTSPVDGVPTDLQLYDIEQGIVANLECKHCHGTMRVTSKNGITDDGTSIEDTSVLAAMNTVLLTDPAKTIASTCSQEGMSTYRVRVSYDNNDGQGMQQIYSEELATATAANPNAHNWSEVEWVTWKPVMVKDADGNDTDVQQTTKITVGEAEYTVPVYEITANRSCGNTGCAVGTLTDTAVVGTEPDDTAGFHIKLNYTVRKKTCTISGRVVYRASVYYGTELIAEYATPAVYTEEAEGHDIKIDWRWEEKIEAEELVGYKSVSAERYCTKCSNDETDELRIRRTKYTVQEADFQELGLDEDGFVEDLGFPTVDGLTVGFNGSPATCIAAGRVSYTTYAKFGEVTYKEEKVIVNDVLGHKEQWSINWQANADKTGAEAWTVTADKKCIRENCPDGGPVIKTEKLTPTYIETDAALINCTDSGMKTWDVTFTPSDGAELVKDAVLHKEEVIPANDNHNYADATATWVWTFDADGNPVATVVFRRVCRREASHVETIEVQAVTEDKIADCTQAAELNFTVEAPTNENAPWSMAEGAELTQTFYWEAGTHNAVLVPEQKEDCNKEGWEKHYKCTRCKNTYTTASCRVPYHIPEGRLGHLYGEPEYRWVEGKQGVEVEAVFTCTRGCTDTPEAIAGGYTRVKVVKATVGTPYAEVEASCPDAPADKAQEGSGYYPVTVDLENRLDNIEAGEDLFESEIEGIIPAGSGSHVYQEGLCKWCNKVEPNVIRAVFHGFDGKQTQVIVYRKNSNGIIGNQPFAASQTGYEFEGWKIGTDGTVLATFDALKAEFDNQWSADGKQLNIYASYKSLNQKGSLKVVKRIGEKEVEGEHVEEDVIVGEFKTVTAQAEITEGGVTYYFQGWEIGGTKVSTSLSYDVFIDSTEEIVVTAVYTTEQPQEELPIVAITNQQALGTAGSYSLAFTSTISTPEGCEKTEVGFLYSLKASITDADMEYGTANTSVKTYVVTGDKANVLTIAIPDSRLGSPVAVKAYVKWTKGNKSGIEYSDFVQTTWNTLNGTVTPEPAE